MKPNPLNRLVWLPAALAVCLDLFPVRGHDVTPAIHAIETARAALDAAAAALSLQPTTNPAPVEALARQEIHFHGDGTCTVSDYLAGLDRGEHGDGARAAWARGKAKNPEQPGAPYSCLLIEQPGGVRFFFLRTTEKTRYLVPQGLAPGSIGDFKIRFRGFHSYLKGFRLPDRGRETLIKSKFIGDRRPYKEHRPPRGWR